MRNAQHIIETGQMAQFPGKHYLLEKVLIPLVRGSLIATLTMEPSCKKIILRDKRMSKGLYL